ncbi:helix-turn-helix transcriptional regulator [Sphingomonas psychrotolerans]|nr:hypothetical protein [Sphingomonas psychrotolerans]
MYSRTIAANEEAPVFLRRPAPNPRPTAQTPEVIVIEASGKLVEATVGGHKLLAEGSVLRCSFGRVAGATQIVAGRLDAAIASTIAHSRASATFEKPHQRLDAEFFAIQPGGDGAPRIIILLKPVRIGQVPRLRAVRSAFGLTQAEFRLLEALYAGCSIPEAAHLLGVARSTARTHLQRVFDKTGVRRQADLMRVVACG